MTRNTVGKKRRSRADACPWSSSAGWKALSVQDELLLGAEEDGFAGVEILEDPSSVIDPGMCVCAIPREALCRALRSAAVGGTLEMLSAC